MSTVWCPSQPGGAPRHSATKRRRRGGVMRIDRDDRGWAIVDGLPPAVARWRLVDGRVVLHSASGRVYEVGPESMPVSIAVGLLALRDAEAFLRGPVGEE